MKKFWKKTAAGLLALLIVAGGTPIQPLSQVFEKTAITASAASTVDVPCSVDTSSFDVITDVKILGDSSAGDIKALAKKYRDNGWAVIEQDLNNGASGWYIYLAFKIAPVTQQSDLSNAIRDIIIVNGSDYGKQTTLSGITDTTLSSTTSRTFYKCDSDGDFNSDNNQGDKGNLNRGTGSGTPDLYMYYTREAGYDNSFLTYFTLSTSSSGSAYCYNNSGAPADLNPGSKSAYLHLDRKSVSASYYGFTANTDLVYSGSAQTLASPKSAYHGTVYWSVNGGSWTTSQPKATNAGTYTVKSYVKGDFGFGNSPEVSKTVTIAKSDANKPTVTIDSPIEAGKPYSPALVGMAADRTGAVTYLYSDSQNGEYKSAQPSTEGTYWVKAKIAEDTNYNAYTTAPVSFKILNRSKVTVSDYENGTVTPDKLTALTGETVTLNISPTYNHFVKSITVNDKALSPVDGVYSFAMPSQEAVIAAEFAQIKSAVVWKNWDGNVLETDKDVHYGTTPEYNGKTPTKPMDDDYIYTFSGWSPAISSVEGDIVYTAQFSQTVNKFAVTWKNGDTVLETDEDVRYGETPEYNGETPTKEATAQYTYTFSGWSPAISSVEGDIVYTAQFSQTVNKYTVTWKNGDTVLETDKAVEYGETPEYNGKTPTKPMDDDYIYTFSGWSPAISSVEGDIEYTAQFTATARTDKCGDKAYWSFDTATGKLTISGTGAMYDYSYNTLPWHNYKDNITSVEIENGIISIGNRAFSGCESLSSITIPDSVTSIGNFAFNYCKSLSSITIPDSVTSIGNSAFYYCTSLESIPIPDSVTSIEAGAFAYCNSLTSITIPDSVTSIGAGAFANCNSLTSITIPDSVTSIGDSAFLSCTSLESIPIPDSVTSIGKYAFYNCTSLTSITIPASVTSIGNFAFYNCTSLASITIPDSVESIGNKAFMSCRSLTSIVIPAKVTNIDADAFYGCTNITDVYCYTDPEKLTWNEDGRNDFISDGSTVCHVSAEYYDRYVSKFGAESENPVNVTFKAINPTGQCGDDATWELDLDTGKLTISGTGAMYDYSGNNQPWYDYRDKTTSVEIENGITSIGKYAFYGCTGLSSITIPDSVTSIGDWAFDKCESLTSITIPDSVKIIGDYAFSSCLNLTSITIPASVTSIGAGTFSGCIVLTSITIPDSVTSIGNGAFATCNSLTSVTIPDSVTNIGAWAFQGCKGLTSITIPDSVTNIGRDAFRGCTNITDVYCYADPENLTWDENGCDDFIKPQNSKMTVCHVPAKYYLEYVKKFGTGSETPVNVTFATEAPHGQCGENAYCLLDSGKLTISGTGAMYDYKYNTLPWYNYKDNITSVEIENGITSIGEYAFYDCSSLTSITIPDGITSIGKYAFCYCTSLESIPIPDSVTSIGNYAFKSCTRLTSITMPDSVISIGREAFRYCHGLKSIVIPAKVTNIDADAFLYCTNIKDVYCYTDPDTLTWNEGNCNDFIRTPKHTTVCHVPEEYLDGYNTKFGAGSETPVNVTFKAMNPSGKCGVDATWEFDLDTGKLTISGTGAMYDYKNNTQPWYKHNEDITSVEIKNGITSIGKYAFQNCTCLTSITMPDSVTSIGVRAFSDCESLSSITIPDSVTSIGEYAFYDCGILKSITIPDSVTSIGNYAFVRCTGLTSITIPAGVTNIGRDAFFNCTDITDVYCYANPANLTWDESSCDDFRKTPKHTTVCHVPAEYLSKYQDKFGDSVNVTFKAMKPSGKCGENATWELDYESGKLTISGTGAMYDYSWTNQQWYKHKENITSVKIENGITSIGNFAFYNCTSLASITIPDSVTSIGSGAFYGCTSLASITIPAGVTSIGYSAFYKCTGLTSITMPDSVTSIGAGTFQGCIVLTSITIPDSVTNIGRDAFYDCTNITDVYCYADPENLTWDEKGCDDFIKPKNSKMTVCHVPTEYLDGYNTKFGAESENPVNVTFKAMKPSGKCGVDETWEFDLDTGKLTISGTGAMYDYKYNTQPWHNYKDNITSVEIENGIISIGKYAFYDCGILKSITIPDSVKSIGESAFQGCKGLTSITIPASVTSIGDWAFSDCTSLESIPIPDSVTSIGVAAFLSCTGLTSITIPDSVTNIGKDAFYNCTDITDVYCYANPANLTWDEEGCDDFIKTPKHTTVCHVPAEYLSKYQDKFGDSVNVTFKGTPAITAPTANTLTYNGGEQELVTAGSTDFGKVLYSLDGTNYSEDIPKATNADTYTVYYKVDTDNYYYAPQTVEVTIADSYTITWKNGDEILETDNYVNYGTTPEYNGTTPSMTGKDNEMYVFSGWSPMASEVTGNATYTAQFIKYTKVSAVPATYTSAGNSEYYTCSDGKYYVFDGNEFTETAENSWIIPKLEITDEAVINAANITLGGELGLNFYLTIPDVLVNEGAKVVMNGPEGEKEVVLSTLTKDDKGRYKITYKLKAIFADRDVSLKITSSTGDELPMYKESGDKIENNVLTYSIYDYVESSKNYPALTDNDRKIINAMYTYVAYSAKWKYHTDVPAGTDELSDITQAQFEKYALKQSGGSEGIKLTGAALVLDSNTAFRLYFTSSEDVSEHTVKLGDTVLIPHETSTTGKYYVDIENIGAGNLKTDYTVSFDNSYSVTVSAMTYVYNYLRSGMNDAELYDLLKALYAYSEAVNPTNES